MATNRQILLDNRPDGEATVHNFKLVTTETPPLKDGQVLVRHHYLSLDPYMRGRMNDSKSYAASQPLSNQAITVEDANLLLRDFLQERWKGLTPILWAQQLKQERLDELIYLSLLNADHLPDGDRQGPLSTFWRFDTTPNEKTERDHA